MAVPGKKKKSGAKAQPARDLIDVALAMKTAPCVPALREAVVDWRRGGYAGCTETTSLLLNFWFSSDHRLPQGRPFSYHSSQREAVETFIYVWEVAKVRSRKALLERFAPALTDVRLPSVDLFARNAIKMATGSGKTKVMSLLIAWQFLNAAREKEAIAAEYAKTFVLLAPNIIVLERLKTDFYQGRIFKTDPIIPRTMQIFWDLDCVMRGDGERPHSEGVLFLTNIQQFYARERETSEPEALTAMLGPKPPEGLMPEPDFEARIAKRQGRLAVLNDEAHHTHEENNEWNLLIRRFNAAVPLAFQADFSATPRFSKGQLFPWVISDYPLKQAIIDGIVKRPTKGIARVQEARSDHASIRYKAFLTAGVERWKEYKAQLLPYAKKPILFIMLNSTAEADEVGEWLQTAYPSEFGEKRTLVIHTDRSGDISNKKQVDEARKAAREVDDSESPVNAIVSVLMLREGWDVENVTVVVGLRPFSSKANILPEQAIGRGLRLMFRGRGLGYAERVDVIGNKGFLQFVDQLEKDEDISFETFELGHDRLKILVIEARPDRKQYDIEMPTLSPILVRKKTLAQEIGELEVDAFDCPILPMKEGDLAAETFVYEGFDIITLDKHIDREYHLPEPQTPGEVIGYYARRIAQELKLPSQFSSLAPKVKEFFERKAFGKWVDLESPQILKAMSSNVSSYVCLQTFRKALKDRILQEQVPQLSGPGRKLSELQAFPWSRPTQKVQKTIFNLVPCSNEFECEFTRFLDQAQDVAALAKLPEAFGFCIEYTDGNYNLRNYYPDFVAVDLEGSFWLLETKGMESEEVQYKDRAAALWCENATQLTGKVWRYKKVPQLKFQKLQPDSLHELAVL